MKNKPRIERDACILGDGLSVTFQRTLRIPDDGKSYPLPPGFGAFPVRRVDDFIDRVPAEWREHGGVFLPLYQREAMWLSFSCTPWWPHAVKVAVGKVCAITGARWSDELHSSPQDYLVTPPQPWLDGICVREGQVRQFVAMPLGLGYTVEKQITGEETVGGIQLVAYAPLPGRIPPPPCRGSVRAPGAASPLQPGGFALEDDECVMEMKACSAQPTESGRRGRSSGVMGIAAGGTMAQKVYRDPHGVETWNASSKRRVFVHIVNSELWREITGERPPETPITASEYARHGLPWFDLYDEHISAVGGGKAFADVRSVKQIDGEKSALPLQDDQSVSAGSILKYSVADSSIVRDGNW